MCIFKSYYYTHTNSHHGNLIIDIKIWIKRVVLLYSVRQSHTNKIINVNISGRVWEFGSDSTLVLVVCTTCKRDTHIFDVVFLLVNK